MNFRRIFFFGLWLALGVVGIGIVLPELNRVRSAGDQRAVFESIVTELPSVATGTPDDSKAIDDFFSSPTGGATGSSQESLGLSGIGQGGGGMGSGMGRGYGALGAGSTPAAEETAEDVAAVGSDGWPEGMPRSGGGQGVVGYGRGQGIGGGGGSGRKSNSAPGEGRILGSSHPPSNDDLPGAAPPAEEPGAGQSVTNTDTDHSDDWPEGMPRSGTSGPLGYKTYNNWRGLGSGGGGAPEVEPRLDLADPQISSDHPGLAPSAEEPAADLASETEDLMAALDRKLASLPLANIAFNTPETIPLGDDAMIELLLSLQETQEQLREAISAAGPTESARIQITDQMEARLTGLGFRIEAITPDRQAVSRGQRTWWRWQIEPTKSDRLALHLTLSAIVSIDGVPAPRTVQTFERTIYVEVPLATQVTQFAKNNVEVITTFILIPVVGGLYRHVRKKKRRGSPAEFDQRPRRAA